MRPIIFCIVGPSGVGKTTLAEALEQYAGLFMIPSITDRPRRYEGEVGHEFVEPSDFDLLKRVDMIAFTQWGQYRYCCLKSSVRQTNSYVIDENGVKYLKSNYSKAYKIITIRLVCDKQELIRRVGEERVARDKGKFKMDLEEFDKVAVSTGCKLDVITEIWTFIRSEIEKHVGLAGCEEGLSYGTGYAERD